MARGLNAEPAAAEFAEHATQEQDHADRLSERIAIDSYHQMIEYIGDQDSTTRRLLKDILAVEEEHADDMSDLLARR